MSFIYKFKTDFLALSKSLFFEIRTENEDFIREYIGAFLSIFAIVDENDSSKTIIECMQMNSAELRTKIENVVNIFSVKEPGIHKIAAYFRKLKNQEYFIFLPNIELDVNKRLELYNLLRAKETGENIALANAQTDTLFEQLFQKYDVSVFGPERVNIGKSDKNERKCRFCNNTTPVVSFKNKSHAISEALGNKTVILHEECDNCNTKFSQTIEPDIILYLSLYRTIFDVKGKDGSKKFLGKNFKLENENEVVFTMYSDKKKPPEDDYYNLYLEPIGLLNSQNIYKCLCKYFISVVDAQYIPVFKKTIEWINGDFKIDKLPKIGEMTSYHSFSKQPKIVTYIRKTSEKSVPFAVGEFYFTCKILVFIVPLFSDNEMNFLNSKEYKQFWKTFKHYDKSKGWAFNDYSTDKKRDFFLNLDFKKKGQ